MFPDEASCGLPVNTAAARAPSAVAACITVLLLWRLGSAMFGRRTGIVAGVLGGSSLAFLLYAPNATAEMLLTVCCTWAYFHFWFAATAERPGRRFLHAMLFYVAMGFAMLAKGPAPIAVTAIPLVAWWYSHRAFETLAEGGPGAWRAAAQVFVRDLVPRTIEAFTRLWLLPGLIVFAAVFVPWMLQVADRHPHAWNLWNWQYWQRAQGNYEDSKVRGAFFYVPIVVGLVAPWVFLVPEALAAPWMKRYARLRHGLFYAGLWVVVGVGVLSLMSFKRPYYILPAVPGLILLKAVVADRFFSRVPGNGPLVLSLDIGARPRALVIPNERRFAWIIWGLLAAGAAASLVFGRAWLGRHMPDAAPALTLIIAGMLIAILLAGIAYIRGRGWVSLGIMAVGTVASFQAAWYAGAPAVNAMATWDKVEALARALDAAGVPRDARVLWVDRRPDARLSVYFDRDSTYLVTAEEIVTRMVDRTNKAQQLEEIVTERADALLASADPVYLIVERRHYDQWDMAGSRGVHFLADVRSEFERRGKDWVIVCNDAARRVDQTTKPASQAVSRP